MDRLKLGVVLIVIGLVVFFFLSLNRLDEVRYKNPMPSAVPCSSYRCGSDMDCVMFEKYGITNWDNQFGDE